LARMSLSGPLYILGDLQYAQVLREQVVEALSRTLPDNDVNLQMARGRLGDALRQLGDLQRARVLQERALEVLSRQLPDEHPNLQVARQDLAATLYTLGDLTGARALNEKALARIIHERSGLGSKAWLWGLTGARAGRDAG